MNILRFDNTESGETIKCTSVVFKRHVLTFALAETTWYTKGKVRNVPVYANRKGLFLFKLAVTLRPRKRKAPQQTAA